MSDDWKIGFVESWPHRQISLTRLSQKQLEDNGDYNEYQQEDGKQQHYHEQAPDGYREYLSDALTHTLSLYLRLVSHGD